MRKIAIPWTGGIKRALPIVLAAVMLMAGAALAPAHAATINLTDGNSSVTIDTSTPTEPTGQRGVTSWIVDGIEQLFTQQWWIGTSSVAGQLALDQLTFTGSSPLTPTNYVQLNFTGAGFAVSATYSLLAGTPGSHTSDLGEAFRVTNTSDSSLTFRIYLYSDFDLGGSALNDTVQIFGLHHANQTGKGWIADTVLIPDAKYAEANLYHNTLDSLVGAASYTLNGALGPVSGDATWAFEWEKTLAPGGSFLLSLDKNITPIPIPPSALLLGSGLLGLLGFGIRRRQG
jgi:hypothetical protein